LTGVHQVDRQDVALRLVVLVDRLYDRDVPVVLAGDGADLFTEAMLAGGYRKKYARALSRLAALTAQGEALAATAAPGAGAGGAGE
ncbi:MAG: cell division protein ZapE, partial [Cellulomonas iranensis]|uniref:AFG1/ZapE family ATPase n=1 Tax=Cellulomonas iranensis TaxID=76862 RepID=UPI001B21C227